MGYDVFKRRCAHRILSKLETCPDCLASQREAAVAKAGPREVTLPLPSKVGLERAIAKNLVFGVDYSIPSALPMNSWERFDMNSWERFDAVREWIDSGFVSEDGAARLLQASPHTDGLAIRCKCDYCADARRACGVERDTRGDVKAASPAIEHTRSVKSLVEASHRGRRTPVVGCLCESCRVTWAMASFPKLEPYSDSVSASGLTITAPEDDEPDECGCGGECSDCELATLKIDGMPLHGRGSVAAKKASELAPASHGSRLAAAHGLLSKFGGMGDGVFEAFLSLCDENRQEIGAKESRAHVKMQVVICRPTNSVDLLITHRWNPFKTRGTGSESATFLCIHNRQGAPIMCLAKDEVNAPLRRTFASYYGTVTSITTVG